jgi:hypothetical protein
MKPRLKFLFILLVHLKMFSQNKILSNIDANKKQYEFYLFKDFNIVDSETGNSLEPTKFILNDQAIIQNIVQSWKGDKAKERYMCGYDYEIYIVSEGEIIDVVNYNSECKQVVCSNGVFNVKDNPFISLSQEIKFSQFTFKTENLETARAILKMSSKNKKIFIPHFESYHWNKYDGRFFIQITNDKKSKKLKPMKFYDSEMHKIYIEDDFFVQFWGCCDTYEAWIYSNNELCDKFNLYGRKGKFEKIKSTYEIFLFGNADEINQIIQNK